MPRTTTQRDHGPQHQTKRAEWAPHVAAGRVNCHAGVCLDDLDGNGRRIRPWLPWDLDRTPDGSRLTGPKHARCLTAARELQAAV